jgi:hypothetical protein
MTEPSKDSGMIQVLVERLEKRRLPRALSIKEKVDAGEVLSEFDIEFLEKVLRDANNAIPLLDRHPEYQPLAGKLVTLYKEITAKALENQKAADKSS